MEKDILSRVIEVEKEIQDRLRVEKDRSLEFLEAVKREVEDRLAREEEILEENHAAAMEKAKTAARERANETLQKAEQRVEKYRQIEDSDLKNILMRRLSAILPTEEGGHRTRGG